MSVHAALPAAHPMPTRRELLRLWLVRLMVVFGILLTWGVAAVFSTTVYKSIALNHWPYTDFLKHLIFIAVSFAVSMVLLSAVRVLGPVRSWARKVIPLAYVVSLILVGMVTLTSYGESYGGATLTLRLGSFGFQPSELLKITTVLCLAMIMCWWRDVAPSEERSAIRHGMKLRDWVVYLFHKRVGKPVWPDLPRRAVWVLLIPVALTLAQKDMGSASLILGMGVITILLAGVDWRQLVSAAVLMVLLGMAGVMLKPDYVAHAAARLQVYRALLTNQAVDQDGEGFQITQSRGALALGGLTGRGYLQSEQKMNRLPVATEDFVFPIMVEEFGYIGGVSIMLLFLAVAWCGINLANACQDPFNRSVIGALGLGLCMQAFVNIATTTGTLPVTGITLPFFSEGGTSILVSTLAVAIMIALAISELRTKSTSNSLKSA